MWHQSITLAVLRRLHIFLFILNVFLVNPKHLSHKQRNLSALHQTNIVGCEDLLIHSQSGIAPGWSGAGGVVGVGAGGLFGNWPRMGRRKKAQHYVIVFLCPKRLSFM